MNSNDQTGDRPKSVNRHKGIQIPTRLPPEMYAAVAQLAEAEFRPVAQMGAVLIREALEARGKWPKAEEAPAPSPAPKKKAAKGGK